MNVKRLCLLLWLAGCATNATLSNGPVNPVRARLASLPACAPGAEVGVLVVKAAICTKKHCEAACCNQCGWTATFETRNGQPVPVEPARVQALLGVAQSALDCEIAGWAEALAGQSLSLEAPECVVR